MRVRGFTLYSILPVLLCLSSSLMRAQGNLVLLPVAEISQMSPDSSFLILKEHLRATQSGQDRTGEAICLQKMGELLYHSGNYSNAIEHLLRAEQLFREIRSVKPLADNLNLLGIVYYYNRQPLDASIQFQEALKIYSGLRDYNGLAATYGQIGHIYEKKRDYDSAYYFQKLALSFAIKGSDKSIQYKIYENIGSIYEDKGRYDSAAIYFRYSLDGNRQSGNWRDQIEVLNNLGDVASKQGDFISGLSFARQAVELAKLTGEKYQLQSGYRDMAQAFFALNKFDSAYLCLEKSRDLVQSIYATDNSHQIAIMQTLYDTEKKNNEITHLNADGKIKMIITVASLILLILSGAIAILIINRQKIKMRSEKLLHEKSEETFKTRQGLMESELIRKQLEEKSLKDKLDIRSRELSSHILQLIEKNEIMEELKTGLAEVIKDDKRDQKKQLRNLQQKISFSFTQDASWNDFRAIFEQAHPSFFTDVQAYCPELTTSELRLLALIKMNLSSADISRLLGITPDSLRVTRYRLKKKLQLDQHASLSSFTQSV